MFGNQLGEVDLDRRGDLYLADEYAGFAIAAQHILLRLEHHHGMTDIMTNAKMTAKNRLVAQGPKMMLEEPEEVALSLQKATRFRFDADVDESPGLAFQLRERCLQNTRPGMSGGDPS